MKKITLHILILVILVELFGWTMSANAQIFNSQQTTGASTTGRELTPGTTSQTGTVAPDPSYHLLAPLPCDPASNPPTPGCDPSTKTVKSFDPTQSNNLGAYLNMMIKIFIGLCAVLSVVMIVI